MGRWVGRRLRQRSVGRRSAVSSWQSTAVGQQLVGGAVGCLVGLDASPGKAVQKMIQDGAKA